MKKGTIIAIGVGIVIILGAIALATDLKHKTPEAPVQAVHMENGVQIIDLRAKGGYTPRTVSAAAGLPTVLRVTTKGTFDCSASIRIPSLNIGQILPQTGSTDIDLGTPKAGTLQGSCGMGMYPFQIEFK